MSYNTKSHLTKTENELSEKAESMGLRGEVIYSKKPGARGWWFCPLGNTPDIFLCKSKDDVIDNLYNINPVDTMHH